jgi:hypothetical protein
MDIQKNTKDRWAKFDENTFLPIIWEEAEPESLIANS